jgi:hypothetical protein
MVLQSGLEPETSPLPIKVGVENTHEMEVFQRLLKNPFMFRLICRAFTLESFKAKLKPLYGLAIGFCFSLFLLLEDVLHLLGHPQQFALGKLPRHQSVFYLAWHC